MKLLIAIAGLGLLAPTAFADNFNDPLHGCIIGTSCFDNGTVTPTTVDPLPSFTFTASSGPVTGDFLVDVLVPNNVINAASLSFAILVTGGGTNDTSNLGPVSATLKGDWTSGNLGTFLGLGGTHPNNPIGAWLPFTQGNHCGALQNTICDPGASGFEVYQVNLGTNELQSPGNPIKPILTLTGSDLPEASLVTAFVSRGPNWAASANSGALFEAGGPPVHNLPEPSSYFMLGAALLGALAMLRKRPRPTPDSSPAPKNPASR